LREADRLKTPELAEQRREQAAAVVAPAIVLAPAVPKVAGQRIVTTWRAVIRSRGSVICAAAGMMHPDPAVIAAAESSAAGALLTVDEAAANRLAAATKGALYIPGIEFHQVTGIAQSARR
jgi:hypothetical protein